jgi:hypothetical protein
MGEPNAPASHGKAEMKPDLSRLDPLAFMK